MTDAVFDTFWDTLVPVDVPTLERGSQSASVIAEEELAVKVGPLAVTTAAKKEAAKNTMPEIQQSTLDNRVPLAIDDVSQMPPIEVFNTVKSTSPRQLKVDDLTRRKLTNILKRHSLVAEAALTNIVNIKEDFSEDNVRTAFVNAHKDQLVSMLEYGIDIFSPFCARRKGGEENWVIDFYGKENRSFTRDLIEDQKLVIMKEYRKQKWKISLVGGSVTRWNGRRHFIAFLERYVMNPKFEDLKESTRWLFSIATIQSSVIAYM